MGSRVGVGGPEELVDVLDDLRVDYGAGAGPVDEVLVAELVDGNLEVGHQVGQAVGQLLDVLEQVYCQVRLS